MNERIKELRNKLDLSAEKFGARVGVTRSAISRIENGVVNVTEQMQKSICREFRVNEEWLRNGTGEMFADMDDEDLLMEWAGRVLGERSESFKKRFVKMLMSLTEDEWALLERKARELVGEDN